VTGVTTSLPVGKGKGSIQGWVDHPFPTTWSELLRETDDASIGNLGKFLIRGLGPVLTFAVLGALVVFAVSSNLSPTYQATATVLASTASSSLSRFDVSIASPPAIDLAAYRSVAASRPIFERARGLVDDPGTFDGTRVTVTAEIMNISGFIRIHARAQDARAAAATANAMAQAVVEWDRQRSRDNLERIVAALESQIAAISADIAVLQSSGDTPPDMIDGQLRLRAERQQQLAYANALGAAVVGMLDVVEPAVAPAAPVAPRPRAYAMIAFLALGFVGFGAYLLWQALDTRVRSGADVARLVGAPVLAELGRLPSDGALDRHAVDYLRAGLAAGGWDVEPAVILVTSPDPLPARSQVAAALARSFAVDARRTLLVDADSRTPGIASRFGVDPLQAPSLETYLNDPSSSDEPAMVDVGGGRSLAVVPNRGRVEAVPDRLRRSFERALQEWLERFDVIVVDATPLLEAADALWIMRHVPTSVLVVDLRTTTRSELMKTADLLRRSRRPPVGVVVVGSPVHAASGWRREAWGSAEGRASRRQAADASALNPTSWLDRGG
jgi:Mrp family chromosome partitioning ATPase